jgi:hypothetical protein
MKRPTRVPASSVENEQGLEHDGEVIPQRECVFSFEDFLEHHRHADSEGRRATSLANHRGLLQLLGKNFHVL